MKYNYLQWLRRILAASVFLLFILAFVFGSLPINSFAHYQVGPALLAGNLLFLGLVFMLTLCLGRVYCSCVCPLGIGQDFLGRILKKSCRKPLPGHLFLRVCLLVLFACSFFGGFLTIYGLLDPYSIFGRISVSLFAPVFSFFKNILVETSDSLGSDLSATDEVLFPEWGVFFIAIGSFMLLIFLVWKFGRAWCNYCPVGTVLGLIGSKSLLRIHLFPEKCVGCKRCEKICKSGCINIEKKEIDNTRCVVCQNCVEKCPKGAIKYGKK